MEKSKRKLKSETLYWSLDLRKINKINYELDEYCYDLEKREVFGCYFLYNNKKEIIYIGMSKNLVNRAFQSYNEKRWWKNTTSIYISFFETLTKSDMIVAEGYFIGKYKPKLNVVGKYDDELTFKLPLKKPFKIYKIYN